MSDTPTTANCPNCGAQYIPPLTDCQVCGSTLPIAYADASHERQDQNVSTPVFTPTYSIASLLIATLLFAVFFGLLMVAPGIAILLAILTVAPLIRTVLVVRQRTLIGQPVPVLSKFLLFLGSLSVTTSILAVVAVSSVGTFCAVCLGGAVVLQPSGSSSSSMNLLVGMSGLAALAATFGVLKISFRWIRARWKHDTRNDQNS